MLWIGAEAVRHWWAGSGAPSLVPGVKGVPSPGGQASGMAGCVIPSSSPWATTRRPGGRAERGWPTVTSRAAPGPPRGRALPGRRDDARAPAWSRSTGRVGIRKASAQAARDRTRRHGPAWRPARTASVSGSPTPASTFTPKRSLVRSQYRPPAPDGGRAASGTPRFKERQNGRKQAR